MSGFLTSLKTEEKLRDFDAKNRIVMTDQDATLCNALEKAFTRNYDRRLACCWHQQRNFQNHIQAFYNVDKMLANQIVQLSLVKSKESFKQIYQRVEDVASNLLEKKRHKGTSTEKD